MKKPEKKAADMTVKELASYIDYSVLKPEFTEEEIIDLTKDGVKLGCATICINPGYMELCEPYVKGSETMLCPVTDFPFGTSSTESRVQQIENVAKYDTVKEVDVVINYGKLRSGKVEEIVEDLKACVAAAHQVKLGCKCCMDAGVDFVKTSTGFLTGYESHGATPEIIQVIMDEVGDTCKIKGSGCIRTREHFLKLIDMGIDRMGIGYRSVPVVLDLK